MSIRSREEFEGKTSGYKYINKAGEPKEAVSREAGEFVATQSRYPAAGSSGIQPDRTEIGPVPTGPQEAAQSLANHGFRVALPGSRPQVLGYPGPGYPRLCSCRSPLGECSVVRMDFRKNTTERAPAKS